MVITSLSQCSKTQLTRAIMHPHKHERTRSEHKSKKTPCQCGQGDNVAIKQIMQLHNPHHLIKGDVGYWVLKRKKENRHAFLFYFSFH